MFLPGHVRCYITGGVFWPKQKWSSQRWVCRTREILSRPPLHNQSGMIKSLYHKCWRVSEGILGWELCWQQRRDQKLQIRTLFVVNSGSPFNIIQYSSRQCREAETTWTGVTHSSKNTAPTYHPTRAWTMYSWENKYSCKHTQGRSRLPKHTPQLAMSCSTLW